MAALCLASRRQTAALSWSILWNTGNQKSSFLLQKKSRRQKVTLMGFQGKILWLRLIQSFNLLTCLFVCLFVCLVVFWNKTFLMLSFWVMDSAAETEDEELNFFTPWSYVSLLGMHLWAFCWLQHFWKCFLNVDGERVKESVLPQSSIVQLIAICVHTFEHACACTLLSLEHWNLLKARHVAMIIFLSPHSEASALESVATLVFYKKLFNYKALDFTHSNQSGRA